MTTIERAWRAFLDAIEEAKTLHSSGAADTVVLDLLQHARELLEIIDDEIALNAIVLPAAARLGLTEMRSRLASLEGSLVTKH